MFAGVGTACGYLFLAIPNVELVTLILFQAGYTLGLQYGVLAAISTSIFYFGFNPQGGFFPPLLAAQILGMSLAPVAGVLYRRCRHLTGKPFMRGIVLTICAFIVTFLYDLFTNLSFPIATGMNFKGIISVLFMGIPFSIVHIISNILIFNLLIPPLIKVINQIGFTSNQLQQ